MKILITFLKWTAYNLIGLSIVLNLTGCNTSRVKKEKLQMQIQQSYKNNAVANKKRQESLAQQRKESSWLGSTPCRQSKKNWYKSRNIKA
jgi:hypothetical protein